MGTWHPARVNPPHQSSTPLHRKASPGMSHHPLPRRLRRQKWYRGCMGKIPPVPHFPPAPTLRNTAQPRPWGQLLRTALVTPPGTLLPPPRAGLAASADAATLTRLLCRRARLGRELGLWHNQGGHHVRPRASRGVTPQGICLQALSRPTLQFMSAKCLFPKLLRLFDHIYTVMEKPYIMYTPTSINMYMTLHTI